MTESENIYIEEVTESVQDSVFLIFLILKHKSRTKAGLGFIQIKRRTIWSISHSLKNNINILAVKNSHHGGDFEK